MNDERQPDDENQSMQLPKHKWSKINFWSIVCAVVFFFMGLIEVAVMEFFSIKFTVIFVSVMGSLAVLSLIVWFISNRKTR